MLHIQKENSETIVPTKEYSAADMNSYLFPLIYEEGIIVPWYTASG